MKRSCFTGLLLSAALFASEIRAASQTNVYSLNVATFVNVRIGGLHATPSFQQIWSSGPISVSEITSWTDASGQPISGDPSRLDQSDDIPHSHTQIQIGPASFSIPLAPRWTGILGTMLAAILLSWDWVISRRRKQNLTTALQGSHELTCNLYRLGN
jgi:hypothetical protein